MNISLYRKIRGLSQVELAEKVNISAQAVSKWENDLSAPDISTLPILADILNVSLDELLGREVEETKIVPEGKRKDINSMLLKINVLSSEGDIVKVNLPLAIIKLCIDAGMELPNINGFVFKLFQGFPGFSFPGCPPVCFPKYTKGSCC